MRPYLVIPAFVVVFILILASGCRKDALTTDPGAKLRFSVDTLTFDTVFTTLASTTLPLKVFNDNKNKIRISDITLAGGEGSSFRINVDGLPGNAEDIEIEGEDSMYIYVEVTVDPVNQNNPLIILDSIQFLTNGNAQSVILAAWGQDAHFYNAEFIGTETWEDDKPYVIFNNAAVDTGETLTIDPGVTVYFADQSSLYVFGSLVVNGGCGQDTVTFRGIRLEDFYDDLPGQWGGIQFFRSSTGNVLTNMEVTNSSTGITVGAFTEADLPNLSTGNAAELTMDRVVVKNSQGTGVYGFLSNITAQNCLITNCGEEAVNLVLGGTYNFSQSTIANYGSVTVSHERSCLSLNNGVVISTPDVAYEYIANLDATFTNCIIHGSLEEEIVFENDTSGTFNYLFENCLLRTTYVAPTDSFVNVLQNVDPQFVNRGDLDFHLAQGSPCIDAGKSGIGISDDLDCGFRFDPPDIGAFEYAP